ncbi:NADP-dependent oxidoreductase [Tessaracoccus antarcticus]|uniref:NADP-dependent oxidoreductase n=1 Tax=Tessaracoccus antarcticus TaxID=2479848 RepID=UPI0018F48BEA|nr:NADP-dependent oxidoreductase [Tessaracoccus antarcticus]
MTAVRAHRRGGPQELVVETVALPPLGPDEVLVAVHAVAITFTELEWDESWTHAPVIPGHEFSGVVEATGADVSTAEVGDPVFGLIRFDRQGAAADYVAVPARDISRKPESLSHTETAALPLAGLTAWQGLFDLAKVQPGERVLVLGGGWWCRCVRCAARQTCRGVRRRDGTRSGCLICG